MPRYGVYVSNRQAGEDIYQKLDAKLGDFANATSLAGPRKLMPGFLSREDHERALNNTTAVMLVVIGSDWRAGIEQPDDPVRVEIEIALKISDIPIISLILDDVPGSRIFEDLPASLRPLARLPVMLVRDEDKDLDRVAEVVVEIINEKLRGGDSYWRLLLQTARAETLGLTAGSAPGFGLQSPDGKTQPLVFLCHSSGDKEQVRALYRTLNADGIECWFDEEDLLPGQNWGYEIGRAIKRSKFVLACLSKASITKSGYVQKELKKALDVADEQPEGVAFLIPVRLEECEIPDRLSQWQWVDLFVDGGYQRLLRVLKAPQNSGN